MNSWRWNGRAFEVCFDVPLHDRGFRYGMSVFESFPVLASEPQHFDAHLMRLRVACTEREFDFDEMAMAAADLRFMSRLVPSRGWRVTICSPR